uniref:Kelch-like protein 20 n=1 Tax=Sus scrofa TaxID=9823 RepID=A0A8D0QG79_PIG
MHVSIIRSTIRGKIVLVGDHQLQINQNSWLSMTPIIFLLASAGENEERRRLQYSDTASSVMNSHSGHSRGARNWITAHAVFESTQAPSRARLLPDLRRNPLSEYVGSRGKYLGTGQLPAGAVERGWGGNRSGSRILLALASAEKRVEVPKGGSRRGYGRQESVGAGSALECGEGYFSWCMEGKPMRRCTNIRPGETGMDVTSRCTLGDPNKLPEGVPQPARMPYISDKHPRQTLEVINLLRKHRELCDVVLVVGAKKIYAHRVILSACSPYFRAMFTGELAESRQTEVVIRDIDERAMELLIDFAYTSQITVEEGNVQTLLPAACLLQLAEIQEACCEFLKRQLDPSNCLGIRAFADTHSCRELLRIADKFTQHNFQEVMESEEFMLLPANQLIDIISSDELNVRSEEQVFNAVMAWVKYSIQERRPQLPQVLQHVRLPLLSPKFLVGTVGSDPLIKSDEECRDLVDEAKNYLLLPQERPLMQGPRTRPRKPIRCGEVLFAVGGWCSGDAISSVERYDPQTNEWRMVASMSKRRCGVGVSVLDDLLYAVGGHDGSSYLNSVERYDPKENKWTRVASMSTRRLGVAVAVLGGFLYAVGGSDGTSPLNTVERYNPQENRWHTIAPMGTRRKHLGCAVYQDMIYAVGGRDDTTELSSAERYNPRTNQWSPVVAMTSRRSGVGLAVVNGQLMAVGGFDGTTYLKTIEVFDPDANTWRLYGGMNYRRLGGGVGVIKMTHCESHIW